MLICRFGIDEKRKTTLSQMRLQSRWDRVVFLFSDYSNSTVGENGDSPENCGFPSFPSRRSSAEIS